MHTSAKLNKCVSYAGKEIFEGALKFGPKLRKKEL